MPAPPLVVPNAVQVRLVSGVAGANAINVLHGRKTSGAVVNQALANTLGAAIKSAFTANLGTYASTGAGLLKVGVRDLTSANQAEYLDAGAAVLGTDAGDQLPPSTCLCVSLGTALAGKSFRGRVYVGGFTETNNAFGGIAGAQLEAAVVAYIAAVQAAMRTSGLELCVLSRPAYAYQDTRTWQLPEGGERIEVLGNGKARAGGTSDVTNIKSRSAAWETMRSRGASVAQALVARQAGLPSVIADSTESDEPTSRRR
jgi:hypothetical protein